MTDPAHILAYGVVDAPLAGSPDQLTVSLRNLDADRHLRDPAIKQRYVTALFDHIAPRYDRFTRWFSYGMDGGWKRELALRAVEAVPKDGVVLDLACGTGDLALDVARRAGLSVTVLGMDPAPRMLAIAGRRRATQALVNVCWTRADMMSLPLPRRSVDVVTVGYGIRNTPDHHGAIHEIARVLRPGGWLLSLDFFQPTGRVWRRLFLGYLAVMGAVYGWAWHRHAVAYGYIAKSIRAWVTAAEFEAALSDHGFIVRDVGRKLGGGVCVHVAELRRMAA